uniref:Putative Gag-Pol n=1 Tax=Tanacetum cinerariifolium TaxID=118510 RepID=A0A6L2P158_TANCI|nr:putative Gag-Pol precursor [Tanacetum cinerariifolium]
MSGEEHHNDQDKGLLSPSTRLSPSWHPGHSDSLSLGEDDEVQGDLGYICYGKASVDRNWKLCLVLRVCLWPFQNDENAKGLLKMVLVLPKEDIELAKRASKLTKEKIAAKLKDQWWLEEKTKSTKALGRKKQNVEKTQIKAYLRTRKKLRKKKREADLKGHIRSRAIIKTLKKLIGDEGPSSRGTKLNSTFITAKSPEEGARRALPKFRVTRPQPWSIASFSPNNGHPSPAFLVDSPIILEALIEGILVRWIYVDGGSSSKVMYEHCFQNLRAETRENLKQSITPLVGFSGEVSYLIGTIILNVTMAEPKRLRTIPMEFAVVKIHSPYNVILGRTSLRSLGAVASTIHSMIKFPIANGIETMITKRETLYEYKAGEPDDTIQPPPSPLKKDTQTDEKVEGNDKHLERPLESKPPEKVVIHGEHPDQTVTTGGNFSIKYMTGIPHFIVEHELKTYHHIEPRVQRKRSITPDKRKVVKDEVVVWLKARIVRKTKSLMGFKYKCFLNAYKGYQQIQMTKKDEEKTMFHTDEGVFCYTKMPFGLKNAEATYERLVDTIFEGQIGRNLKAYVDDMVIKSKTEPEMIKDVEETLLTLKKVNMKLNPKKCSFGMEEGKFLGYIVTSEGIKANTEKAKAIVNMPSPSNLKQILEEERGTHGLPISGQRSSQRRLISGKTRETSLNPLRHTIKVITNKPISQILNNREATGRLAKWGIELEAYGIKYAPRSAIKGQVLVDFLADTMAENNSKQVKASGSNDKPHTKEDNKKADALSKLAVVQCEGLTKGVLIEELNERSVDTVEVNAIIKEATRTWMTPIQEYIEHEILPEDVAKARTIREKARNYTIEEGVLYQKSYLGPLLRCIGPQKAKYLIKEIHIGSCGMYDAPRRAVHKAMNVGYFWPSMHRDANNEISSCDSCQVYATVPKLPKNDMISVTLAWPVRKYGMDIVGALPEAPGKIKYLIVAIDYFIKWIKAKAITSITGKHVKNFIFDNIVCMFRIPATIIIDNGTQFIDDPFKSWPEGLGIKLVSTLVYHPQANEAMERANQSIMQRIKTRLHQEGGAWVEELPNVLWAHKTTPKMSNGETPFSLAYGTEAVIPAEIGIPIRRTIQRSDKENEEALRMNLNLLEEQRETATIKEARRK